MSRCCYFVSGPVLLPERIKADLPSALKTCRIIMIRVSMTYGTGTDVKACRDSSEL